MALYGFKLLCPQLQIYIIVTLISIVLHINAYYHNKMINNSDEKDGVMGIIINTIVSIIWGYLIYILCNSGHGDIAWILLFLPFIILLLVIVVIFGSLGVGYGAGSVKKLA